MTVIKLAQVDTIIGWVDGRHYRNRPLIDEILLFPEAKLRQALFTLVD